MEEKIKTIFNTNNFHYDYNIIDDNHIEVEVINGDWKHDHLRLELIMKKNLFFVTDREIIDESFDDSYSCRYKFTYLLN